MSEAPAGATGSLLAGITVVNTGINVPIAVTGARLAELGATVTKVEPPGGDPVREYAPAWYAALTAGQQVLELDLKQRGALDTHLAAADLLLTSSRPAALQRLGLGWEPLHTRFPRLSHVALVGYPSPDAEVPGHDLTYSARHGLLMPPDLPRTLVADLGGAERVVSTACALVLARDRDGEGRFAEVALSDAALLFAQPWLHGLTTRDGLLGGGYPCYGLYESADGWIALAALEGRFSEGLLAALGEESADAATLQRWFRQRTSADWEAWAHERDLPISAVQE